MHFVKNGNMKRDIKCCISQMNSISFQIDLLYQKRMWKNDFIFISKNKNVNNRIKINSNLKLISDLRQK